MEPKYSIGDRVLVVHRKEHQRDHTYYYSYMLNGSTGTIDEMTQICDGYVYHLCHDDTVDDIVVAHAENFNDHTVESAWYEECCLDPAPLPDTVDLKDFESVLC